MVISGRQSVSSLDGRSRPCEGRETRVVASGDLTPRESWVRDTCVQLQRDLHNIYLLLLTLCDRYRHDLDQTSNTRKC